MGSRKIGEILIELGLIDEAGLKRALEIQATEGGTLGRAVSGLGLAEEQQVSHAFPAVVLGDNKLLDIPLTPAEGVHAEFGEDHTHGPVLGVSVFGYE